jgi:hypothetical protein
MIHHLEELKMEQVGDKGNIANLVSRSLLINKS